MMKTGHNNKQSLPSTLYTTEYFLTACEGYDEFLTSEGQQLSRRLKTAFSQAGITPGMRVLDAGCGRGEIIHHCIKHNIECYGVDYAEVACRMSYDVIYGSYLDKSYSQHGQKPKAGVARSDVKKLPFPDQYFDRILMFDVVEHLYPWELHEALLDVYRVLKPDGRFVIHTAPNRWYDLYAYPIVRMVRTAMGQGANYPKDPRAITPVNQDVHVNEQDILSMRRALKATGFVSKIWLDSPPQQRDESFMMAGLRHIAFNVPPFRWFFERELFAVATKH